MDQELNNFKQKSADLSDIVLEKKSKKSNIGTKKWLLTIASAIVLFLIVLLLFKMLKQADITDDTKNEMVASSDTVETITKDKPLAEDNSNAENLFKKEPIIDESSDTDEKFEEMVRKLKEQDSIIQHTQANNDEKKGTKKKEKESVKEVKPKEFTTITQEPKEVPVITTTPVIQESVQPVENEVITVRQEPIQQKPKPRHIYKPKVKKSVQDTFARTNNHAISGYFIQVGATSRAFPDKRFLSKIKNNGFDYIVHTLYIKGRKIKKVLVGPYNSKSEAMRALGRVKNSINPSAFVYRLR